MRIPTRCRTLAGVDMGVEAGDLHTPFPLVVEGP